MPRGLLLELTVSVAPVLALFAALPWLYDNQLLLLNFVVFLILSHGLNLTYGFSGYLPFGYVGFFGAGAYGFALTVMHGLAPPLAAVAAGGAAALLAGLLRHICPSSPARASRTSRSRPRPRREPASSFTRSRLWPASR